jgi:hypothetical protein
MIKLNEYYRTAPPGSPERRAYHSWSNLRGRCDNERNPNYPNYGGRDITYDPRWKSFAQFLDDMGLPPEGKCLERIDNDGPYNKDNCRWATRKEQSTNKRSTRIIEYEGARKSLTEWAAQLGLPHSTLRTRLENGWPLHRALSAGRFHRGGNFIPFEAMSSAPTRRPLWRRFVDFLFKRRG